MSRGIRNDNPLNIRRSSQSWVGMRKRQTDSVFVQFDSRVYGYRAAFVLLRRHIGRGRDTIGKIIAKWAPSRDANNTLSYINYVSRTTNIHPSHHLRWEDRDQLIEIVLSMAHMESGIIEERSVVERAYHFAEE